MTSFSVERASYYRRYPKISEIRRFPFRDSLTQLHPAVYISFSSILNPHSYEINLFSRCSSPLRMTTKIFLSSKFSKSLKHKHSVLTLNCYIYPIHRIHKIHCCVFVIHFVNCTSWSSESLVTYVISRYSCVWYSEQYKCTVLSS